MHRKVRRRALKGLGPDLAQLRGGLLGLGLHCFPIEGSKCTPKLGGAPAVLSKSRGLLVGGKKYTLEIHILRELKASAWHTPRLLVMAIMM